MRRAQNATASSSKLERPDKNDDDCEYKVSLRVGIIHLSLDISKMITMVVYIKNDTVGLHPSDSIEDWTIGVEMLWCI